MSGTNSAAAPPARTPVLEKGDTIQAGQMRAAISSAALGLVSAGVHEGEMKVSPRQALEAAAAVFQIVHCGVSMRALMATVAREQKVTNAYGDLLVQAREEAPSR